MRAVYILPVLALLLFAALSSVFIVDEREKVLVLQFGQVKQVKETPGLGFKLPFLQEVVPYDDRILGLPTPPMTVTMDDDRRLVVDAFARWKIVDLVKFRESVGAGDIEKADRAGPGRRSLRFAGRFPARFSRLSSKHRAPRSAGRVGR